MKSTSGYRRTGSGVTQALSIGLGVVAVTVLVVGALSLAGVVDLSLLRSNVRSTDGLTAVPVPARTIASYTRVTRDHFWDPANNRLTVVYLPPNSVTPEMLTRLPDILGRVLDHDKPAGFVFTDADFLPRGTREGLVAGIPAGKRAIRVEADKVQGLFGLRAGDRFDLVATLAIEAGRGGQAFGNVGGVYGQQLALQAQLSNWQKQATVRVMVQNGVVVEPMITRQVPVFTRSLTQGGITRMRPLQEIVIAVDPDEVARLTEAMAVGAEISTVPRSGRPDDPPNSITPDLRPVSPFGGGAAVASYSAPAIGTAEPTAFPTAPAGLQGTGPFSMVETISGSARELKAVPRR
jgi:Flp pilus assembly protein CpaB